MTEQQATLAAQEGDAEAFGWLVRRYERLAFGHALALLGRREDARDAVQDSFLAAYRALRRFDAGRPFFPWFYVILRNRCRSLLRGRRPAEPLDESCLAVSDERDPEETNEVRRALWRLPDEDREILVLKYLDGRRYHEIAEMLGLAMGTVSSRLHAARRRLADALKRSRELEPQT